MKLIKILLVTVLSLLASHVEAGEFNIKKVVIDAGHGGKDPGAVSGNYKEKDITLKVALKLGRKINSKYPDIDIVYTRKTDVFIPLDQRGQIANKANADLFISIHVNSSKNTKASGTETFVMGVAKSTQNLEVAMLENAAITFEEDYSSKYEGYDPKSSESFIIFSLMQYGYLNQSLAIAQLVQNNYSSIVGGQNRGVKQALFLVLWKTAMPSILTEIGFISNAADRALLVSDKGQNDIVDALFSSFIKYNEQLSGNSIVVEEPVQQPVESAKPAPVEKAATTAAQPTKHNKNSKTSARSSTGGFTPAAKRGQITAQTGNESVVRGSKKQSPEAENEEDEDEDEDEKVVIKSDTAPVESSKTVEPDSENDLNDESAENKPAVMPANTVTVAKKDVGQNLPVRVSTVTEDNDDEETDDEAEIQPEKEPASTKKPVPTENKTPSETVSYKQKSTEESNKNIDKNVSKSDVIFKIQIYLSIRKVDLASAKFKGYKDKIEEIKVGNLYKYYVESSESYQEALNLQKEIRKTYADAFIVAFQNEKPVPLKNVIE